MSLTSLEEALPALRPLRLPKPCGVDWGYLSDEAGLRFPSDYRELVSSYPGLVIDGFLLIRSPRPGSEDVYAERMAKEAEEFHYFTDGASPYPPYPDDGGLLAWGDSDHGDHFYWKTVGHPDEWPMVVYGRNQDWVEFPGTLTEYLTGLVIGTLEPYALPPDFPGRTPPVRLL